MLTLKFASTGLAVASVGISTIDLGFNGPTSSNLMDVAAGLALLLPPVGTTLGGLYFGSNFVSKAATGADLGQRWDSWNP
jgi:hypothetical protein